MPCNKESLIGRRRDLDWLQVSLFALLVSHHITVGFVDWGVDILNIVILAKFIIVS